MIKVVMIVIKYESTSRQSIIMFTKLRQDMHENNMIIWNAFLVGAAPSAL